MPLDYIFVFAAHLFSGRGADILIFIQTSSWIMSHKACILYIMKSLGVLALTVVEIWVQLEITFFSAQMFVLTAFSVNFLTQNGQV